MDDGSQYTQVFPLLWTLPQPIKAIVRVLPVQCLPILAANSEPVRRTKENKVRQHHTYQEIMVRTERNLQMIGVNEAD